MRVSLLFLLFTSWFMGEVLGQSKQHFQAGSVDKHKKIRIILNASSVSCRIRPTYSIHAINIFGYPTDGNFNPITSNVTDNNVQKIKLTLDENANSSLSSSLSDKVFSFSDREDAPWYLYLSQNTPLDLELNYGVGNSSVDLSGLSVENFKINTGSAEIRVGFDANKPNHVQMDTLMAKVDLGTLELDKLDMARAKNVIAQIGFGKLQMRMTDLQEDCHISASVGAGMLEVIIDKPDIPVIIHLNNSPLCKVKLLKDFKEIAPETFVNQAYQSKQDSAHTVSFNIDVAMGKVMFKQSGAVDN